MRKTFTDLRKIILGLIESSLTPLTAQQILNTMPEKCDLSNVYRGIRFLEKEHLIESFAIDCEKEGNSRFYYGAGDHHAHYIHCAKCHSFTRIKECFLGEDMKRLEKEYNFNISKHLLLFIGVCNKCSSAS